tara:strand:- start:142 stop:417 length:276 start_codon:yes stop_codon:yes gene_type:complete
VEIVPQQVKELLKRGVGNMAFDSKSFPREDERANAKYASFVVYRLIMTFVQLDQVAKHIPCILFEGISGQRLRRRVGKEGQRSQKMTTRMV